MTSNLATREDLQKLKCELQEFIVNDRLTRSNDIYKGRVPLDTKLCAITAALLYFFALGILIIT